MSKDNRWKTVRSEEVVSESDLWTLISSNLEGWAATDDEQAVVLTTSSKGKLPIAVGELTSRFPECRRLLQLARLIARLRQTGIGKHLSFTDHYRLILTDSNERESVMKLLKEEFLYLQTLIQDPQRCEPLVKKAD